MNMRLCILFILIFSLNLTSQFFWSPPEPLCNPIGDNHNPVFAQIQDWQSFDQVLLWERDFGLYSQIFMKDFANPDSEFTVNLSGTGVYSQHPQAASISSSSASRDPLLLVWQTNETGNFDLYSIEYDNGSFRNYRQITADPADDVCPSLFGTDLVWVRNGTIYFNQYVIQDSSWWQEEVIDSGECFNPNLSYNRVAYQKKSGSQHHIHGSEKITEQWTVPTCFFADGDNQNPVFNTTYSFSLLWQHFNGEQWDIVEYGFISNDTTRLTSPMLNDTNPIGCGEWFITNPDDVMVPVFAFEGRELSVTGAEPEIYIGDYYMIGYFHNITQYSGKDQNPCISSPVWEDKIWLAWERLLNGHYQIWGCWDVNTEIEPVTGIMPADYTLYQNYPNPFNHATIIEFGLPRAGYVTLVVYNVVGEKVAILVSENLMVGNYEYTWDARGLASGVYFYKLEAGSFVQTKKMLLIR